MIIIKPPKQSILLTADLLVCEGWDSAVRVATGYGLDGPGIEFQWGGARFSAPIQNGSGNPPASYTMETGVFPGLSGRDVALTTYPI